jgi:PHD/YefM family antitoxin component YafN of YafNO toxin-antitoxin module
MRHAVAGSRLRFVSPWLHDTAQAALDAKAKHLYNTLYIGAVMRISISEARARLPELAQSVMDSPGRVIIIEHRDRKERVVLTAESYLRSLERKVEAMKQQPTAPFKLFGSMTSDLTDEELEAALAAMRAEAAAEAAAKIKRILEE